MDGDGAEDDFNGSFGTYSDTATFTFALTFTRGVDTDSLQKAIEWNIDTSVTGASGTPIAFDPATDYTTTGTDFIYTFYYEVQGLYGANGTYSIGFNNSIEDDADNTITATDLNTALSSISDTICSSGTCQFDNDPVTLLAATFNPSTAVVLKDTDSAPQDLQVTLTFSQPVSFTGDTSDIKDDFDLQFATLNDAELASTDNLESTLQSTQPHLHHHRQHPLHRARPHHPRHHLHLLGTVQLLQQRLRIIPPQALLREHHHPSQRRNLHRKLPNRHRRLHHPPPHHPGRHRHQ